MVKCARRSDGKGLYYLFACVFKYIFNYLLFLKKRGPERGKGVKNWDGTRQDEIP